MAPAQTFYQLRPIEGGDDRVVAAIIRTVMPEFGCVGPGYSLSDPEIDHMSEAYQKDRHEYWVLCAGNRGPREGAEAFETERVVGGAGFAPLRGGETDTCELRKMYILREARGFGQGRRLLEIVLSRARQMGFRRCYLETTERMTAASSLYRSAGFNRLSRPEGNTGHSGCDSYFAKPL